MASDPATINTDDFKIGDRVWVGGIKAGIIAFIGEVQFAQGEWAGVVLDSAVGKNDGSVNGLRYFMCEPKKGIFSNLSKLTKTYIKTIASSTCKDKSLLESKAVRSLDNTCEQKSQKVTDQVNNIPPSECEEVIVTKHMKANAIVHCTTQSEDSPKKSIIPESVTSLTLPHQTSAITTFSKRKASISSSSSQSSGRIEGSSVSKINLPFKNGESVLVNGTKEGIVRFIGEADFAKGVWVGVELKEAHGRNDGSVAGKRYFQCPAMHGLFAPAHKVQVCNIPIGAAHQHQQRGQPGLAGVALSKSNSHNSSFTNNKGSQESISSIGSAASSASRRMKLGITSLSGHRTKGTFCNTPTLSALQKTLKEKEEHIEQLIKERDLDRSEFIRTAAQIDEVEGKLMLMQSDKRRLMNEMDSRLRQAEELIITLEGEKNEIRIQLMEEKRKYEDLQFSLEEANIEKSDIQGQMEKDSRRLKELDEKLKNEMHLNDKLTNEVKSLKMHGLNNDDPIDEYLDQIEELTHKLCIAENNIQSLHKDGNLEISNSQKKVSDVGEIHLGDSATNNDLHLHLDVKTLKNQLKVVTQDKLFAEAQQKELEENLKKVSAEKELIELELNNLVEEHSKLLDGNEKLLNERLANKRIVQETGFQIKDFEEKVEQLTCDFAMRMESLKKRTETAEEEAQALKTTCQQMPSLKLKVESLSKQVQHLRDERDSMASEIQKLKPTKVENNQTRKSKVLVKDSSNDAFINSIIKTNCSNDDNHDNHDSDSIGPFGVGASFIEKLKSEKDFAESQIEFLNAVIVDLQRKNTDLEKQLKTESSCSMTDSLLGRRPVTLRLFCDICDVFDQHDTEDCPMQHMTSSNLNISLHHGSINDERPYCTSCEVFGHTPDHCKDEQTTY